MLYLEVVALTRNVGYCFASNSHFARQLDRNEKYISGELNELQRLGFIGIDLDRSSGNGTVRRIYLIHKKQCEHCVKNSKSTPEKPDLLRQLGPSTPEKPDLHSYYRETKIIKNKEQTASAPDIWFAEIWQKYPAKLGKKEALRRFKSSVRTEEDFSRIKTALNNYEKHLKANDWKRPMHGKTWFNEWEDWVEWQDTTGTAGKTPSKMNDERREAVKERLRQAYTALRRKEGYLNSCDPDDPRRGQLMTEIETLQKKIQGMEGALSGG